MGRRSKRGFTSKFGKHFAVRVTLGFSWTRSLIATLPQDNQVVLHPCLPAMKQDSRILMVFLPYIVLHSVISDVKDNREKMYTEIKTVTSSFDKKRQLQDVFN